MTNVMLANVFDPEINPAGYLLSEKLNGVRAVWNGHSLESRNGNIFQAPKWFTKNLPSNIPLDMELWIGRGKNLQKTVSIVTSDRDKGWDRIRAMCFDIPVPAAGVSEVRQQALMKLIRHLNIPHVRYVPQTVCNGSEHLRQIFNLVVKEGAEGLMLQRPRSLYEFRRSSNLLKMKAWNEAEATVVSYQEGSGKYVGMLGALVCQTVASDGKEAPSPGLTVKVGTGFTDHQRKSPLAFAPIGSIITYQFSELTPDGQPFHPSFVCVRKD